MQATIHVVAKSRARLSDFTSLHLYTILYLYGLQTIVHLYIVYNIQVFVASVIAQLVKNPPAMQETLVQFLGWEDPLEKGKATHSSILAWRIPWTV